jgi:hypothetical protein
MSSSERNEYVYWPAFCLKAKSCSTSDLIRRSSAGIRTITYEFVPVDPLCVITLEVQGAVIR